MIHGETVKKAFPDWHSTLRGSRNADVTAHVEQRFQQLSARLPTQASEECVDSLQITQEPVTTDDEAGEFEPDPLSEPQPPSFYTILGNPSAPNKAKKPAAVPNQKQLSEPQPPSVYTIPGTPSAPNKAKKPAAVPNQKPGYLLRVHPAMLACPLCASKTVTSTKYHRISTTPRLKHPLCRDTRGMWHSVINVSIYRVRPRARTVNIFNSVYPMTIRMLIHL